MLIGFKKLESTTKEKRKKLNGGEEWADVMKHISQAVDFPIRLIRSMSAMLLEAKASITSSLTDISVVILPDSHRTSRGRARLAEITEWMARVSLSVDEF